MEGKPISSLQLCQNQGENKVKKSELTYWFNYKKSYNTLVTYFSSILSNLCIAWLRLPVAHHNSHINAIFVYLPMQKLFVGKIYFIRVFFYKWQTTTAPAKNYPFYSLYSTKFLWLSESFQLYGEIPSRKEKYPVLRTNTISHQLINYAKISYFIVSLVFSQIFVRYLLK